MFYMNFRKKYMEQKKRSEFTVSPSWNKCPHFVKKPWKKQTKEMTEEKNIKQRGETGIVYLHIFVVWSEKQINMAFLLWKKNMWGMFNSLQFLQRAKPRIELVRTACSS